MYCNILQFKTFYLTELDWKNCKLQLPGWSRGDAIGLSWKSA